MGTAAPLFWHLFPNASAHESFPKTKGPWAHNQSIDKPIFRLGMYEGAAAPSYLRPGLGLRRAGVSVRKQRLRTSSRAKRGLRNPQNRLCGSRLEALWASKSPKATATAKSKILTPRRWSGPSGRFLYHFTSRPNLGFAGLGFRFCGALWAVLEPPAAQSAAFGPAAAKGSK